MTPIAGRGEVRNPFSRKCLGEFGREMGRGGKGGSERTQNTRVASASASAGKDEAEKLFFFFFSSRYFIILKHLRSLIPTNL